MGSHADLGVSSLPPRSEARSDLGREGGFRVLGPCRRGSSGCLLPVGDNKALTSTFQCKKRGRKVDHLIKYSVSKNEALKV